MRKPPKPAEAYRDEATYRPARLETPTPAHAVGSLGPEAEAWLEHHLGITLWPWQRHVLHRALEVDEYGQLVWRRMILTVPRQCGKSHLALAACSWRTICNEATFDEPGVVVHMASKRQIAREVWTKGARLLTDKARDEIMVRKGSGTEAVEYGPHGSKWLITSATLAATPGLSVSMAFVDEAWDVPADVVLQGLEPTMLQTESPQMWLVSTAGDSRSDLLRQLRDAAIAQIHEPAPDTLLLEWSAPPEADVTDPATWEAASPIWDERRQRVVEAALRTHAQDTTGWEMQYLNRWAISSRGWLPAATWQACLDERPLPTRADAGPGACAVEVSPNGQLIGAVLAVQEPGGKLVVRSKLATSWPEMHEHLARLAKDRQGLTVLHHESMRQLGRVPGAHMQTVKRNDALAGFQATRSCIEGGQLAHTGDPILTEQVLMASLWAGGQDGYSILSQKASPGPIPLAKALVWAAGHQLDPERHRRPMIAAA